MLCCWAANTDRSLTLDRLFVCSFARLLVLGSFVCLLVHPKKISAYLIRHGNSLLIFLNTQRSLDQMRNTQLRVAQQKLLSFESLSRAVRVLKLSDVN